MLTDVSLDATDLSAGQIVDAAVIAESSGFDGVWMYDHLSGATLGGDSIADPWPLLGAIAASTERVSLGPLVTNATTRHPAHVAVASATLQDLSGGRFVLGIGAGAGPGSSFADEMLMVGLEPKSAADRRRIVIESIAVIRRLWTGGGGVEGEHHSLHGAEGFHIAVPPPPIIVGANGPKMAAIAGLFGDGVNLHSDEADLDGLISITRDASPASNSIITVEAPMKRSWIDGSRRARVLELGVDRLILKWRGAVDGLDAIQRAGVIMAAG